MIEIERTFLVSQVPSNLNQYKSVKIKQGYISATTPQLRIRQSNDKFEITKKIPIDSNIKIQEEINIPLSSEEFAKLWPLTISSIEKIRYYIPLQNQLIAELNVFSGKLDGYMLLEVEFPSENDMKNFTPPDWFGDDISLEDIGSNRKLSTMTIDQVQEKLRLHH